MKFKEDIVMLADSDFPILVNRPGVARAVLQTAPLLTLVNRAQSRFGRPLAVALTNYKHK